MDESDGSLYRIKSAIDSTLERVEVTPGAAKALRDSYKALRDEAKLLFDDEIAAEYERLFPSASNEGIERGSVGGSIQANYYYSLLARLSGWLEGIVQDRHSRLEAAEYARVRAQQESRG